MNKICRRDGELQVMIEIAGVSISIGLTEFRSLLICAMCDLPNASDLTRLAIGRPVMLLTELTELLCSLGTKASPLDDAANLVRYHATGNGGETDLEQLRDVLAVWKKMPPSTSNEWDAFRSRQRLFAANDSKLLPFPSMVKTIEESEAISPRPSRRIVTV
jgi:hypothetical protein